MGKGEEGAGAQTRQRTSVEFHLQRTQFCIYRKHSIIVVAVVVVVGGCYCQRVGVGGWLPLVGLLLIFQRVVIPFAGLRIQESITNLIYNSAPSCTGNKKFREASRVVGEGDGGWRVAVGGRLIILILLKCLRDVCGGGDKLPSTLFSS